MSQGFRAYARYEALAKVSERKIPRFKDRTAPQSVSEIFGCDTFDYEEMKKTLPATDVELLKQHAAMGSPISLETAHSVAAAVKQWAVSKGATHYTHWFQPQTDSTAEKHDAFLDFDVGGRVLEKFTGELLIRGEPDASSFPSGGRRETFEARGYTIWDASSFMFLMETKNGKTLTIPSLFVSYSGEALDAKTPLLNSMRSLNKEVLKSLELLGEKTSYVRVNCGPEQEFFVVDAALASLRPDLMLAGKTVLGSPPQKGQQLDDNYFGSMDARVMNMIMETEYELIRLGVPIKTRHNEVAPAQFEMAPVFEDANLAADHNRLLMATLRKVSEKHNLKVLFHEKPFQGLNGSGKHLNWSMSTAEGVNLLSPGEKPHENVRFLYFLAAALKAVKDGGDLLRAAVAVPGNDFRMGAQEAPPAIMSVFLGETISKVVNHLIKEKSRDGMGVDENGTIDLDLARIPVIIKDNTDRNRTSPFAFTGNKFEFRALGSSQSISVPVTYLNVAVSCALAEMNQSLERALEKKSRDQAVLDVIVETLSAAQPIHFDGDGYSEQWQQEAERRGLSNMRTTPEALGVLLRDEVVDAFVNLGIMSHRQEIEARYNVFMERYVMLRLIEMEIAQELIDTHVYPAALAHQNALGEALESASDVLDSFPAGQKQDFTDFVALVEDLSKTRQVLGAAIEKAHSLGDGKVAADYIASEGVSALEGARKVADTIEQKVDDTLWSLPRYRELLFAR